MTSEELRSEMTHVGFKKKLKEAHGDRCVNCGDEMFEWHHVVPIFLGGTNAIGNIVPLCHRCHRAAHNGHHMTKYRRKSEKEGRPRKTLPENWEDVVWSWVRGDIDKEELHKTLGYTCTTKFIDSRAWDEFRERHGIEKVRNQRGFLAYWGNLRNGAVVSTVFYNDGRQEEFRYEEPEKEFDVVEAWCKALGV